MRTTSLIVVATAVALASQACVSNRPQPEARENQAGARHEAIYRLLANPSEVHDKTVQVVGCLSLDFEDTALYADCGAVKERLFDRSITLDLIYPNGTLLGRPTDLDAVSASCAGLYFLVEGTFTYTRTSAPPGVLRGITRFVPWGSITGNKGPDRARVTACMSALGPDVGASQ
jgi:hypothetical protein